MNTTEKNKNDYWHLYYPFFNAIEYERTIEEYTIGEGYECDVHHADNARGVIIFLHGIGLYARFCAPLCAEMKKHGFHIIAPTMPGHGLDEDGNFTVDECLQCIRTTIEFAREKYPELPLFLTGGSMGGALAYYAAAEKYAVDGVVAYCLFTFDDNDIHSGLLGGERRTRFLTWLLTRVARFKPGWKVPLHVALGMWFSSRAVPVDWKEGALMLDDPYLIKYLTLGTIVSLAYSPAASSFEEYSGPPICVVLAENDRLLSTKTMKVCFERLRGVKECVLLPQDHWPVYEQEVEQTALAIAEFCGKLV